MPCLFLNWGKWTIEDIVKTINKIGIWAVSMCVCMFACNYMSLEEGTYLGRSEGERLSGKIIRLYIYIVIYTVYSIYMYIVYIYMHTA